MRNLAILCMVMVGAVGCEDNPMSPSSTQAQVAPLPTLPPPGPTPGGKRETPTPGPRLPNGWYGSIDGPRGCLEPGTFTWDLEVLEAVYGGHLVTAAFYSTEPGCQPTSHLNGGSAGSMVSGPELYSKGDSGRNRFSYVYEGCGRGQFDIAVSNTATGERQNILGVIVNTGVACEDPVTPVPPPPPPPMGCPDGEVMNPKGRCQPPVVSCKVNCGPPPPPPCDDCGPPPPPCEDEYDFFGSQLRHGSGDIQAQAQIGGSGMWVLRLFAASSQQKYERDAPDFTKGIDKGYLKCGDQQTLNTSYRWENHRSTHWWSTLERNGVRVFKSQVVVKP